MFLGVERGKKGKRRGQTRDDSRQKAREAKSEKRRVGNDAGFCRPSLEEKVPKEDTFKFSYIVHRFKMVPFVK